MKPRILVLTHYAMNISHCFSFFFFFNDTATTEIYTLSLHDALPISAGESNPDVGHDEPEQRDRLQGLAGREQRLVVERRAGPRVEQVDGHLARRELGELERKVDALVERLAHAEDPAAAQLHAGVLRELRSLDAVVVCVGRADRRKHLAARLEVVVVAPHARRREPLGVLARQQPERARDLEARLAVHGVDGLEHPAQQPLFRAADGHDDAELRSTGVARRARRRDDVVQVEEGVHVDAGLEPRRLRAERAVLGAGARLGVDEALELDLGTAVGETHAVRQRNQVGQPVEGKRRHRADFVARQRAALLEQGAGGGVEGDGCLRVGQEGPGERRGSAASEPDHTTASRCRGWGTPRRSRRPRSCSWRRAPTLSATGSVTRISPGSASLVTRAARLTTRPIRSPSLWTASPACTPMRSRRSSPASATCSISRWMSIAHSTASAGLGNCARKPSPCVPTSSPPRVENAARTYSRYRPTTLVHSSSPTSSARRVESTMSLNITATHRFTGPSGAGFRSRRLAASERSMSARASPTSLPARDARSAARSATRRRRRRARPLNRPASTNPRSISSAAAAARITQTGQKPRARARPGSPAISDRSENEPLVRTHTPTRKPHTATETNRWSTKRCTGTLRLNAQRDSRRGRACSPPS